MSDTVDDPDGWDTVSCQVCDEFEIPCPPGWREPNELGKALVIQHMAAFYPLEYTKSTGRDPDAGLADEAAAIADHLP